LAVFGRSVYEVNLRRKILLVSRKSSPVVLFVRTEPNRKIAFIFFDLRTNKKCEENFLRGG